MGIEFDDTPPDGIDQRQLDQRFRIATPGSSDYGTFTNRIRMTGPSQETPHPLDFEGREDQRRRVFQAIETPDGIVGFHELHPVSPGQSPAVIAHGPGETPHYLGESPTQLLQIPPDEVDPGINQSTTTTKRRALGANQLIAANSRLTGMQLMYGPAETDRTGMSATMQHKIALITQLIDHKETQETLNKIVGVLSAEARTSLETIIYNGAEQSIRDRQINEETQTELHTAGLLDVVQKTFDYKLDKSIYDLYLTIHALIATDKYQPSEKLWIHYLVTTRMLLTELRRVMPENRESLQPILESIQELPEIQNAQNGEAGWDQAQPIIRRIAGIISEFQ